MANEIGISVTLTALKGSFSEGMDCSGLSFTLTGSRGFHGVQSVGTSEEPLDALSEFPAGGFCLFRNLDAVNYVQLRGSSGATPLARIGPGEPALLRLDSGSTPTVKANTAACLLEFLMLEA